MKIAISPEAIRNRTNSASGKLLKETGGVF